MAEAEPESEIAGWLDTLDPGGGLRRYLPALRREFSSLAELSQAVMGPYVPGESVLVCVEPSLFEVLRVESMGHKLTLAKGMVALAGHDEVS